jgi:hypothetical protein
MATTRGRPPVSDLHMRVLVALAVYGSGDADALAGWIGLPVELVDTLCAERAERGSYSHPAGERVARSSYPPPSAH